MEADLALAIALEVMTANIALIMDETLEKMVHDIKTNISQSLKEVTEHIGEAEQRILVVENALADAEKCLLALEKTANELIGCLHDYENGGRHKNLQVIGLLKKLEETNATTFMEIWIPQILQLDAEVGRVKSERAHRLLGLHMSRLPCVMIVRFHIFSECQRVIDTARGLKDIQLEGVRIHFFTDFIAATQKRRQECDQVRRKLQTIKGTHYAMIYTAPLRIRVNNTVKTFHSPQQVSAFVDFHGQKICS